jgi:tetraacyldisaccharide 4'-kinase
MDLRLQQLWYGESRLRWLLAPLSWLFGAIVVIRRSLFRSGALRSVRVSKPVIVVGNLTVGGTGKTPLVIWLANTLSAQGCNVAVITRGYGGKAGSWPQTVVTHSDPALVGDEAVLIAQQTQAIVIAGPDRVASAQQAIAAGAAVIISDDGLQHYRLQRDCELVVVDASRGFGNGWLLPAGPLREPVARLQQADLVLVNQRTEAQPIQLAVPTVTYRIELTTLRALNADVTRPLADFRGQAVQVVTAIGNPQSFITVLQQHGLQVAARVLPDHAALTQADIEFDHDLPVLMTEKDAVKCQRLAGLRHWAVGAQVVLAEPARAQLLQCIQQALHQPATSR